MVDPDKKTNVLDEWAKQIDLKRKYPGYFNKSTTYLFKGVFAVSLVLLLVIYIQHGTLSFKYAECSPTSLRDCENPFYVCQTIEDQFNSHCQVGECTQDICKQKYISPGDYVGNKPNWLARNYNTIFFFLIIMGFTLNHWRYMYVRNTK